MAKVAIVTDSSACLPEELVSKYGIEIIPMEFVHEGKVYRDQIDITPAQFYELLSKARELPTTSAPSPGTYFEVFSRVAERAKAILVVTPSATLTHAFDSAKAATQISKEKMPDVTIEVLDCGTAAGAQGLVVLASARAAAMENKNLSQVAEVARNLMPKVHLLAFIDTLHYLVKSGRVPQLVDWANSLLKIKPVFELRPLGRGAAPLNKIRTRPKAIEQLMELLKERTGKNPVHCIVMHTNVLDEADKLKERMITEFNCVEAHVVDFTPVMGVHTGPGLLGVAFYTENESNVGYVS